MPSYYDINDIRSRRDSQLAEIAKLKAQQDANNQAWYDKSQADMQKEQLDAATNPHTMALQGAGIGAGFGPVGAGIGAAIGGGIGSIKDLIARRQAGQGWGQAIGGTLLDPIRPDKFASALTSPGGSAAAGSIAQNMAKERDLAARKKALQDLQMQTASSPSSMKLRQPELGESQFADRDARFKFSV